MGKTLRPTGRAYDAPHPNRAQDGFRDRQGDRIVVDYQECPVRAHFAFGSLYPTLLEETEQRVYRGGKSVMEVNDIFASSVVTVRSR